MFPPHHYGGYELQCRDVTRRWRKSGHKVTVLCSDHRRPDASGAADEGDVRRLLRWYWDDHEILRPGLPQRISIECHNRAVLAAVLDEVRPDVVSVWQMGAMSLGLLDLLRERGIPVVCVIDDDWLDYGPAVDAWQRPFRGRPRLASIARRLTGLPTELTQLPSFARLCFISEVCRRRAAEVTGWDLTGALVVPAGIDTDDFPVTGREQPDWRWRLYLPGRIDPRKGISTAIKALIDLPPTTHLTIDGPGDERHLRELKALAEDLGLERRVDFIKSERHSVRARYRAADVCVFPPTWEEPFGLVPLEAMACGTPVVATGVGGSGEFLVDNANCLLFEKDDPRALAAAVKRLAGDAALRTRLAEGGLQTAARYTVDEVAARLEAIHLDAIGVPR